MKNPITTLAEWWFNKHYWTGRRASHQYDWYRCGSCTRIVTWKHILQDGGCPCGSSRVFPTNPVGMEKFQLLFLPWTV